MIDLLIKNASELITCKSIGPKIGDDLNDAHFIQKNCHKVPAIRVDNSDGSISYLGSEEYLTIQITQ